MAYNDSILYGGDLMIFISGSTGYKPIAFSSSAKLSISLDTREVSSKDSGNWKEFLGGKFEWNSSSDQLFALSGDTNFNSGTTGADAIYQYMKNKIPVTIAFASKSGTSPSWIKDSTKKSFVGNALIISFDLTADDNASATYTIQLKGSGELSLA